MVNPFPSVAKSTCSYCGVGCGVELSRDSRGRLTVCGDEHHPVNKGMLCSKGRYLHQTAMDKEDRILYPEMRQSRGHPRQRVSWDAAIGRTASVFKALIDRFGPESVGFYVSGQLLTEEYYVANKLMKGFIGCNNIDTNSRLCMSSAVAGYKQALGDDAVPISYEDIEHANAFFIAGANPAWCHPILFRRIERRKAEYPDTKVIVVDPRRTDTCSLADLHLQIHPGTDVALYNAICRIIIERGHEDVDFVRDHVDGFEAMKDRVFQWTVADAAAFCGVAEEDIELAAEWLASSGPFLTLWAMGLNQSANGVDRNLALLNVSLITGQIGKPGAGPFSLTGQPNAMGGREVGGLANLLAAHRNLLNPEDRNYVAKFWGSKAIAGKPGLTATEMFSALESGEMKAIWIICTNPAVSLPNLARVESALTKARFVVVQDISNRSDTVPYADVVLPAAAWLEKQGTMTNSERRVTYLEKLIDPPGEALPDSVVLSRFAAAMGWGDSFSYSDESEIFQEHCRLTRGTAIDMSGMSYERLKHEGSLQWPCPDSTHPGTSRLFEDGQFLTPNGRARVHAVAQKTLPEQVTERYPFVLLTGRIRDQWHTMTRTGKVARLRQHEPKPYVELHPDDALGLNIVDGQRVEVANPRGGIAVAARVTESVKAGTAFVPMHWSKSFGGARGRANSLTSSRVDPVSKEPDFKYSTVSIRPLPRKRERIVIVGAGAAALEFVRTYRRLNCEDEITVFGKERQSFYNRTMLPALIAGERQWEDLIASDDHLLKELDVSFRQGVLVSAIDRLNNSVITSEREHVRFDRLVLATGSEPRVPKEVPKHLGGVFTLRSRVDAEAIADRTHPGARACILGGGLLGVELADALNARGVAVTLVHRSPVLMGSAVDAAAGDILRETLEERGIDVLLNERVLQYTGRDGIQAIRTHSGRHIDTNFLVIAAGVVPKTELAERASLKVRRGIVVDEEMRTSDRSIYAIGEVAEYDGETYGTTPVAQEQARVAAESIAGFPAKPYMGSTPFNILKIRGLELCSIGNLDAPTPEHESIVCADVASRYYKRCVVHRNRMTGAILVGDRSEFGTFRDWIRDRTELDDFRAQLLRGGGENKIEPPKGRLVCACHRVGEGNVLEVIRGGCQNLDEVCRQTKAGTGCGSCRSEVDSLLRHAMRQRRESVAL